MATGPTHDLPMNLETPSAEPRRTTPPEVIRESLARDEERDPGPRLRRTDLATLCRAAADDVAARYPGRTIEYEPDPDRRGTGNWDPTRIAYAVAILVEDALERTGADEPVRLRWREHAADAVVRVVFPRALSAGDRLVSYFEHGVPVDGATDRVGTLRLVVARKILLQHGGTLARVRTPAGTAYVATLPRGLR